MTVLLHNSAEGGTDGAAATTANSGGGSGDALTISASGSTCTYSSAQAAHGTLSYCLAAAAGVAAFFQWAPAGEASASWAGEPYFYYTGTPPTNNQVIAQVRNATSGMAGIQLGTNGKLSAVNAAATPVHNWANALSAGWYRLALRATKGTSTSDGTIEAAYYALDSATPVEAAFSSSAQNTGTADAAVLRFGRVASVASAYTTYWDDLAGWTGGTGFMGPYGTNAVPVVTPTAATVTVIKGEVGTFSWTESDSDGTVVSRTVTHTSGPDNPTLSSPTTTSRSATFPTQGTHVYTIVATDDDAATSDPVTITVYVTDVTARPVAVVSNPGVWTNVGGAASIEAALADESATTLAQTPDNPAGAAITVAFDPVGAGAVTVKTSNVATSATPVVGRVIDLMAGATVIASATIAALPTVAADHEFTTTVAQTAAITEAMRSALWVRFTDTAV